MNCPNCGSPTLVDQQFCRSCGAGLTADAPRSFRPQIWGLLVLMMVFGGLLTAMAGKLFDLRWLIFTGVFVMVGGMFFVAAYALLQQSRPRTRKPSQSQLPKTFPSADTTNKLLPIGDNDFIPSVTERTTDLLKTPAANQSVPHD